MWVSVVFRGGKWFMFQGETAVTLDDKGRVAIPAAHRDLDGSSDDLRHLIRRPPTSLREAIAGALKDLAPAH